MIFFKKMTETTLFLTLQIVGVLSSSCLDPSKTNNPQKVVASMADALQKKFPKVPIIKFSSLKTQGHYLLIDVRDEKERKVSIIPGAISKLEFEKNKNLYKKKLLIPYCTIGLRSTHYVQELMAQGLKAKNLWGGILAYAHQGMLFEHNGQETKNVHVYSKAWNLVPKNYKGIFK